MKRWAARLFDCGVLALLLSAVAATGPVEDGGGD